MQKSREMNSALTAVSETLYVPLAGRIYASRNFPQILHDKTALALEQKIPRGVSIFNGQTEYTLLASAVRSKNMDAAVTDFLSRNEGGIVVNLGCGLDTGFYRCSAGTCWYELDLPEVISLREGLLGIQENDISIPSSLFDEGWTGLIKDEADGKPVCFLASGLFYYFQKSDILSLIRRLAEIPNAEIVFDTVNSKGMKRMAGYMKQLGHEDVVMYFFVDNAETLAREIGGAVSVIEERDYYSDVKERRGMKLITRISMTVSDMFHMVKMVSLKLN